MQARHLLYAILLFTSAFFAQSSLAQVPYPDHAIKLIVPFPPGGGSDAVGRIVAQGLSERLKVPVVVENRSGAATNIGMNAVAKSAPDGYTLGLATSNIAINPYIYPDLPYNAKRDLAPVGLVSLVLYALAVNTKVSAKSVKELVKLVKSNPDTFNAATAGVGTPGDLALAQFNSMTGANVRAIPFQGAAPAITSLIANTTQMMFTSLPSALPQVRAGRLRLLATTSSNHSADAPTVPNSKEAGLTGMEINEWFGIVAPAKTDPKRIALVSSELRKVLENGEIQQKIRAAGAEVSPRDPAEFGAFIEAQSKIFGDIVHKSGLKMK